MEDDQSLKQKKVALAQSEHASTVLELIKDCTMDNNIVQDTEWKTIVNAITLEVQGIMLKDVADRIEFIKNGGLFQPEE